MLEGCKAMEKKKNGRTVSVGWTRSLQVKWGRQLGEWAGMESRALRGGPGWASALGLWWIPHSLTRAGGTG